MNWKIFSLAIVAVFLLPFASAANSTPTGVPTFLGASVLVSKATYYEPYPVSPGTLFNLWVRVQNPGKGSDPAINGVECKVNSKFPFYSADPKDSLVWNIGSLGPEQQVILKFNLRADENAVPGDNDLLFSCRSAGRDWTPVKLGIAVEVRNPVLEIASVVQEPTQFSPGSTGKLVFTLENRADAVLRNIQLKLDLSSADLPLSPIKSSGDAYFAKLSAREKGELTFDMLVPPSAKTGVYKIPVSLSYEDELGNGYSRDSTVSAVVYAPPQMMVSVDRSDVLTAGKQGKVFIAFTNRGLSDVKRLSAKISDGDGFQVLSTAENYLGDINSDDFETVEVSLFVTSTGGIIKIPVKYSFLDEFNNMNTKSELVDARVYTTEEITALQLGVATGGLNNILFGLAAVVVLYLLYRHFFKRKKNA
jgi:hypothetical protein